MKKIYLPLLSSFLCLFSHTLLAQYIFLKADDLTQNGSEIRPFEDYIVISGVQFGVDAESQFTGGGGSGASIGSPRFREIIITKNADKLTTAFLRKIALREHIETVEIVITQALGGPPIEIQRIRLEDVLISDVSLAGVSGCTTGCGATESFKMIYSKIAVFISRSNGKGGVTPPVMFQYDIAGRP